MSQSRDLKILHIASGDLWAGAEVQLCTLAKTLHATPGVTVTIILLNSGTLEQQLRNAGIEVLVLDESKLNGLQIFQTMIHTVRDIQPDVIHTHRIKENIFGSIAARLNGSLPSLRTVHGSSEHRPAWYHIPKRSILFLDRFCGCYLQKKIIAVSEDLAGILGQDYPPGKITVIENGIALQSLGPSKNPSEQRTGSSGILQIGIAGRLVPVKRVDLFIQAAKALHDQHPEVKASFHIYGDGPLRADLEQLNRQLKTESIVHFEGHSKEIVQRLKELDMLLMTSDHEGLPMILLESIALQVPIVAHAVGGIPTLLEEGLCGILVQDHSPLGYAEAIHELAKSPEKRRKIAQRALARIKNRYSAEQNALAYLEQYKNLARS